MTKQCSKCKDVKSLDDFYKNKRSPDGHRPNCKKCHNTASSQYQQTETYKEYKKEYMKAYRQTRQRRDSRREYHAEYRRNKYRTDNTYKLKVDMRRRMHEALNGNCKADNTKALLGCTYEEARAHIEAQFTEGMSWDKMGLHGIHIDHIRPCASFDLSDPEQQRECFHYTNLQPLWAKDNLEKSDKW